MFFIKVVLHHVLFWLFCTSQHYFLDLNIYLTILTSVNIYVASYFVSLWTIKFLFRCMKVQTENKCVFITGCDSGFGYQSAILLNKVGYKVFSSCLDPNGEGASNLIKEAEHPKKMMVIGLDVTKDRDIDAAYETVKNCMSHSEHLFGLVNNAGIAIATELEWGPDLTDCSRVIDVNLMGMLKVTRRFLPLIRQSKGRIINIESIAGLLPIPNAIFYGISKYGASGFSDNLRIAMHRFGVSVVSINPWSYKTAITDDKILMSQYENSFRKSSEEVRTAYGENLLQKVRKELDLRKYVKESNDVPDAVVSALTVYEPDLRYIVAPLILQPLLRTMLWKPKETLDVIYQTVFWLFGAVESTQVFDKLK